jgi:acyl-coenzyme A thioesterase PaaI-like protein
MTERPKAMPISRGVLQTLHETGRFEPVLSAIPYARLLGLHVDVIDGDPITTMPGAEHLIGNPILPAMHGGTVGALLESAAIFKLIWEIRSIAVPKTINITVDYLRSARVIDTHARAIITKHGRRVANVQVRSWQGDESKPVAIAHAHFSLTALKPPQSNDADS